MFKSVTARSSGLRTHRYMPLVPCEHADIKCHIHVSALWHVVSLFARRFLTNTSLLVFFHSAWPPLSLCLSSSLHLRLLQCSYLRPPASPAARIISRPYVVPPADNCTSSADSPDGQFKCQGGAPGAAAHGQGAAPKLLGLCELCAWRTASRAWLCTLLHIRLCISARSGTRRRLSHFRPAAHGQVDGGLQCDSARIRTGMLVGGAGNLGCCALLAAMTDAGAHQHPMPT